MIPLTNATIAYEQAGVIVARDVQTIIVNRMQVDWITPTSDAATIFPDTEIRSPYTAKLLKDFTGGVDLLAQRISASSAVPSPSASARRTIAAPNTTSASPTPEMGHDDAARRRPSRPVQDRLAEGRRRVGVVVEQPRVAVGQELAAVVDQEQRRVTRDLGGAVRRVVDRHDERVRRQPVVGHDLADRAERGGRHHDVRVPDGGLRVGRDRYRADPVGRLRLVGERRGPLRVSIEERQRDARQHVPEHREMAVALDPGPDERGAWRPPADAPARTAGSPRRTRPRSAAR